MKPSKIAKNVTANGAKDNIKKHITENIILNNILPDESILKLYKI
jgi:hypothetical protein